MTTDSDFARLDKQRGRIVFDPTINAGHILTFLGFMIAGLTAYNTIDKRVTIVEQRTQSSEVRAAEQDARLKDSLIEIKTDLRDVKKSLNDLSRARP